MSKRIAAPGEGVGRERQAHRLGLNASDDDAHADHVGGANDAALDELLGLDEGRVVEKVLGYAIEGAGAGGGIGDTGGFLQVAGHGFLAGDVLAGLERGDGLVGVEGRWGEELDGVDVGVVEHLVIAAVDAGGDVPLGGALLGALGGGVAEGGDLALRVLKVAGGVEPGDGAAADDGNADVGHRGLFR